MIGHFFAFDYFGIYYRIIVIADTKAGIRFPISGFKTEKHVNNKSQTVDLIVV